MEEILEEKWAIIREHITKLKYHLERVPEVEMKYFPDDEISIPYNIIYNLCNKEKHYYGPRLYNKYTKTFKDYTNTVVLPTLREKHDEFLLTEVVKRWNNQKAMVRRLLSYFAHFERTYMEFFTSQHASLHEVGFRSFRNEVYTEIIEKVKDAVITLIHREREGEYINMDPASFKNVLGIFFLEIGTGGMDAYQSEFEHAMLADTAAYYSQKAASWMEEYPFQLQDYLLKAQESLRRETEIVAHYLHASSEQKVLEIVQHELISHYEKQLLEKAEEITEKDGLRFRTLPTVLVPTAVRLAALIKQRVIDEGSALVKQAEDAANNNKANCNFERDADGGLERAFVMKVIELHDRYLQYVSENFHNNYLFREAVEEAFKVFCNKDVAGWTSAELLATCCDNLLKTGGGEKLSNEAITDTLQKVVQFVDFISDRELFEEFYRKKLARRLLLDNSANDNHERSMVTKLKQQYGWQFTSKMERMMKDLALARENQTSFKDYLNDNSRYSTGNPGIDLTASVLTTRFWPGYKCSDFSLPADMAKCAEVYEEFYQTKTKGERKLTWIYSLGTCTINGNFDPSPIELIVTTCQAAVLLLFNTTERLSYANIKGQLNATDEDIVRLLHSLSCAKHEILNKDPATKTVSPADCFEFNANFTAKTRCIKIPLPPLDQEKTKVYERDAHKDMRYAIDSAIIRIMKAHKVLPLQDLVLDCVQQLHVKQQLKLEFREVKKRVEALIAREYLKRDSDNPKMLRYLRVSIRLQK